MPDNQDGYMVALYPPPDVAKAIALPGGEPVEELHLTLAYMPNEDGADDTARLGAILQDWAQGQAPLEGAVQGVGRFNPKEENGKEPFYASFFCDQLPAFRQSLIDLIQGHGYQVALNFTPHITLAYLEKGTSPLLQPIEDRNARFDSVALVVGGRRHNLPLGQNGNGKVGEMIKHEGDKWVLYSKDGTKTLGTFDSQEDAEERERQIQAIQHSEGRQTESLIVDITPIKEAAGFKGRAWDVTIIGAETPGAVVERGGTEYIESANGRLYACPALEQSVPLWNGVKVYDNHLTDKEFEQRQGMRSVAKEWIGTIVRPTWNAAKRQLRGVFQVVDRELASKLKDAYDQGVLKTIGLSIDTIPETKSIYFENKPFTVIDGFRKILSVDLVTEPAAGGMFNRLLASAQAKNGPTPEQRAEILAELPGMVREALAGTGLGRVGEQAMSIGGMKDAIKATDRKAAEAWIAAGVVRSAAGRARGGQREPYGKAGPYFKRAQDLIKSAQKEMTKGARFIWKA